MDSSRSFRFSEIAEYELDEVMSYISNQLFNPKAAAALYYKILSAIETLCEYPESCPVVDASPKGRQPTRKLLIDNFVAYYYYNKTTSTIEIIRIVYSRRDLDKIKVSA